MAYDRQPSQLHGQFECGDAVSSMTKDILRDVLTSIQAELAVSSGFRSFISGAEHLFSSGLNCQGRSLPLDAASQVISTPITVCNLFESIQKAALT